VKTPRPLRTTIKRDPIPAYAYLHIPQCNACEDCSHFKTSNATCTLGNTTKWHLRDFQKKEYERTGKIAICRFMEID
jgi:hypothetical protein